MDFGAQLERLFKSFKRKSVKIISLDERFSSLYFTHFYRKFYKLSKVIEIKDGKIYQNESLILSDIDFEVNQDEFVFLIGKTGSGKSSLLKALYGEVKLSDGIGNIAGFNLRKLSRKDIPMLRRKIGIVFQDFQLLTDRTVAQNLLFVLGATGWKDKKKMEQRALEVLQLVGLETKMNVMPFALSGGEQQRVSIARALLNKPELILADEPTGNLDSETSEEIMRLFISVAKEEKSAVIMATHDMSMVEKFPARVARVENGKVKEISTMNTFNPFDALRAQDF